MRSISLTGYPSFQDFLQHKRQNRKDGGYDY